MQDTAFTAWPGHWQEQGLAGKQLAPCNRQPGADLPSEVIDDTEEVVHSSVCVVDALDDAPDTDTNGAACQQHHEDNDRDS